jgi:broad specificity phosphatase PhoE
MNAASRLTLISHAATEAQRRAAFPLDEPVLELESARLTGLNWSAPATTQVWSAPEQRAQQTSRMLGLAVTLADGLRECNYGRWSGRQMNAVQSETPEGILAWLTDPGAAPHGGESIDDLIARTGTWMVEHRDVKHTVAVTHPAVIRAAIVHALRIPALAFWRFDIAPLTLTDLRFNRNVWTVRCSGCPLRTLRQGDLDETDI